MSHTRTYLSQVLCVLALATSLVASGCGKKDKSNDESGVTAGKSSGGSAPSLPTAELANALKAVPADASAVVSLAFPMSISEMSAGFDLIPFDPALAKEMQTKLVAHSKTHLGIDASKVRSVVVFAHGGMQEPSGAAIVSPIEGTLKGEGVTEGNTLYVKIWGDDDFVAAQSGSTLIVGKKNSVKAALDAMTSGKGLATSDSAFAKSVSAQVATSYFSVAADITKLPVPEMAMTKGLTHGTVAFGKDGIHLAVHGNKDTLELLASSAKAGLYMATDVAKANMESSEDKFAEGAAGIMGYYSAKNMISLLEPKISGETMTLDLSFEVGGAAPMIFVAVTGILAAVAIPAFMKYIKKSKTAEANQFIKKMGDGARVLAMESGKLPASVGPTPPLGGSCKNGLDKHIPDEKQWMHPTWQALQFAIMDPHYYSYEFVNSGDSFQAKAYGDLDCDGVYSTFMLYGTASGEMAGDVVIENRLE